MSTDHQRYSIQNQSAAIEAYAQRRGITLVKTYVDSGKSGLTFAGRAGLSALITDIQEGRAEFEVLLVLDVSRWGRFQDTDESAYYEYLCRRSGVQIVYCAESFENDGTPMAAVLKSLKRAMAAEYSRELSTKVFVAQCRLVERGFRQGGMAGFGLRRMVVDLEGKPRGCLASGESKFLHEHKIKLVPGPPEEVAMVRRIFRLYVNEGLREFEIIGRLTAEGAVTHTGMPWTHRTLHQVLTNEKYVGDNVYNRRSRKLRSRSIHNPNDCWVRARGAFTPIVDRSTFAAAQDIVRRRARRFSKNEMIDALRALYRARGGLSEELIHATPDMPAVDAYRRVFGSLLAAYAAAGLNIDGSYSFVAVKHALRVLRPIYVREIAQGVRSAGGQVAVKGNRLLINEELNVRVLVAGFELTKHGYEHWKIQPSEDPQLDLTVVIRMNATNQAPLDYYIFPRFDDAFDSMELSRRNRLAIEMYRFDTLEPLFALARRDTAGAAA